MVCMKFACDYEAKGEEQVKSTKGKGEKQVKRQK